MDELDVSTVVYLPRPAVYEFLLDFPRYAEYSRYLDEVRRHGDGDPGTEYDLRFSWWKIGYTARSAVTAVDPPGRIDWRVVEDLDAEGRWLVREADPDDAADDHDGPASRVHFQVEFDPDSAEFGGVSLPRFVSPRWVLDRVKPLVVEEARRVVARVVADLEDEPRPVELTVHESPTPVEDLVED